MRYRAPEPKVNQNNLFKFLYLSRQGAAFIPGIKSRNNLPIVVVYQNIIPHTGRTHFSCVDNIGDFEVITIDNQLPEDVRDFLSWYEIGHLSKDTLLSKFLGREIYAILCGIQKGSSGIKGYFRFLGFKKKNKTQLLG